MTQPVQQTTVDAQKGWGHFTRVLSRDLPYQLTHGANALRAVLTLTGKRG